MQRFRSRALIVFLFALILVLMAGRFARAHTSGDPEALDGVTVQLASSVVL